MNTEVIQNNHFLSMPNAERKQFNKNYLKSVVVEFRFPTLLELTLTDPVDIQKVIRERFPEYQRGSSTEIDATGARSERTYQFLDKNGSSIVKLSSSALSFSTKKYVCYEDLRDQCGYLIDKVVPFLDTDFFTRVGMRYINKFAIPNNMLEVPNWINADLVQYIPGGNLGSLEGMKMELAGQIDNEAHYKFRCGISDDDADVAKNESSSTFMLDYDYSQFNVAKKDSIALIDNFHEHHFKFFWWCLGKKAKEDLENG